MMKGPSVLVVLAALTSASAQLPNSFILTKIGTSAQGINDRDQVVGWTQSDVYPYPRRAWIWRHGIFEYLPTPDGDDSYALSINERGDAVGSIESAGTDRATLWADGEAKPLKPFPGSDDSVALDLNESREVCGWGRTITGFQVEARWDTEGNIHDLGVPSSSRNNSRGINNQGDIVANTQSNTYVWQSGEVSRIASGQGNEIDDRGFIVGTFGVYNPLVGGVHILEPLPGDFTKEAFSLNDNLVVVGSSTSSSFGDRAVGWIFLLPPTDLNTLIDDRHFLLQVARDISEADVIVGDGIELDGTPRGFVLTPRCRLHALPLLLHCMNDSTQESCDQLDTNDGGTVDLRDFAEFANCFVEEP